MICACVNITKRFIPGENRWLNGVAEIYADLLFPGRAAPLRDALVTIRNGRISDVRATRDAKPTGPDALHVPILAPGFINLQINGAMDRQYTDDPTIETVAAITEGARQGGTAHVLPTFTTAPGEDYKKALAAVETAVASRMPGVLGMHLEDPFLSPEKPGIHAPENIRSIAEDDIKALSEFNGGKLLVTLAPECQPDGAVAELSKAGIVVFAGHSNAAFRDIADAKRQGLTGATHLFNAMSQLTGREPGVVGAVFASGNLSAGIIADGHHVSWANIGIAARLMGNRLFLVTDAMATLAGTKTEMVIHGKTVRLADGKITDASGRLAGAHISMDACVRNMIREVKVKPETAIDMASANPAAAIGMACELGEIAIGFRASMTLLSDGLKSIGVVIDGAHFEPAG